MDKKPIILFETTTINYEFENMFKKFKRESESIIREVKERRYYVKPSEKKRLARQNRGKKK